MTLDEGKTLWKLHDAAPARLPAAEVLAHVRTHADDFDRLILKRDRREEIAALFVSISFGLIGLGCLVIGLYLASLGAALVVLAAAWVFWKLRSTRLRFQYDAAGLPPAHLLIFEIDKIEAQIRLLRTVFWWYMLPLMTGGVLFMVGLPGGMEQAPVYVVLAALFSLLIHVLNQRVVRTDLIPRRDEWRALLLDLTADEA